jgi:hypothetical protein
MGPLNRNTKTNLLYKTLSSERRGDGPVLNESPEKKVRIGEDDDVVDVNVDSKLGDIGRSFTFQIPVDP